MAQPTVRPRFLSIAGREAPALHLIGLFGTFGGAALLLAGLLAVAFPVVVAGLLVLGTGSLALAGSLTLQRRADTPDAGWLGPGPVALFWLTVPWSVIAPLPAFVLLGASGPLDRLEPAALTLVQALCSNLAVAGVLAVVVVGSGAATWRDLVAPTPAATPAHLPQPDRRGGLLGDVAWGAVLALPILAAAGALAALLVSGTGAVPPSPLPSATSLLPLLLNGITAGLIAPIGEELLYRGAIEQAWARQRLSTAPRAIVFSARLFAFAHTLNRGGSTFDEAVGIAAVSFAIRLPLGIALGWLWIRRRSLVATIVLHAAYNLAIVATA